MCIIENKLEEKLSGDIGKLILRISIAALMLFHGIHKALGDINGIKFLVDRKGKVYKRYSSATKPVDIEKDIILLLKNN